MARKQYKCSKCKINHFAGSKVGRQHKKHARAAKSRARRTRRRRRR